MDHFAGLDASVKETSVCIVDEAGRIVREVKVAIGALRSAPRLSAPPPPARKPTGLPAKRGTSECSAIAAPRSRRRRSAMPSMLVTSISKSGASAVTPTRP